MRLVRLKKQHLDRIKRGEKRFEIRAESPWTQNVERGDEILFAAGPYTALATVCSVRRFPTRDALLQSLSARDLGAESVEEARGILARIYPNDPPLVAWEIGNIKEG